MIGDMRFFHSEFGSFFLFRDDHDDRQDGAKKHVGGSTAHRVQDPTHWFWLCSLFRRSLHVMGKMELEMKHRPM